MKWRHAIRIPSWTDNHIVQEFRPRFTFDNNYDLAVNAFEQQQMKDKRMDNTLSSHYPQISA